jgi:hypothetical protein
MHPASAATLCGTRRPHAVGNFLTPSGKCEFKASMAAGGNFVLPLFRQGSNEFQAGVIK